MKAIGKLVLGALMLAGTTAALAPSSEAAPYGGYGYGHGPGYGRPGAYFSFGSGPAWSVGNSWYLYPRPVYPYPAYGPPVVAGDEYGYAPNNGRDYAQGYARGADGNPQRPDYWYFCANPEGYYPYIQDCDNWQQEPSQGGAPPGDYPEYQDPDFRVEQ